MVVQHNISAMNANRYYGINNKALAGSLEKLSSGYAINRAGDNAAGLAVSEKMRAQIGGLTQASKNAEDGISMVQTFEGALQETDSILQRMRTLAVQSANGNYQDEVDRDAIQLEFDQLNDELNQIADTDFNGVVMLNGGVMADGTVANNNTMVAKRPNIEQVNSQSNAAFTYKSLINGSVDGAGNGSLSINGSSITLRGGAGSTLDENGVSSLGGTSYSADVSVTGAGVSGAIDARETYAIDSLTTNITIHGTNYAVSNNKLYDEDGNTVTQVDGLGVNVTSNAVTLNGSYSVTDSKVTTGYQFADSTSGLSGAISVDSNGNYSGTVGTNGVSVEVKADGTGTTTNNGIKYDLTNATVDTATGKITSKIDISGSTAATPTEVDLQNGNVTVSAANKVGVTGDSDENKVYELEINGTKVYANVSAFDTAGEGEAVTVYADKDSAKNETAENAVDVSKLSGNTVLLGDLKKSATGVTYTQKEAYITVDGKKVSFKTVDSDDGKSKTLETSGDKAVFASTGTNEYSFGPNNSFKVSAKDGTYSGSVEITSDNNVKGATKTVGEFDKSQGVSTSNAYEHGSRNLTYADSMTLQVGARSKDAVDFNFSYTTNGIGTLKADLNASARGLGTDQLSVKTSEEANFAIDQIDNAINKVNMVRATFGAVQNRLEHKINTLDTNNENLTAAESRIRDTQMDKEMMKFTSSQILSQASQSMLAQANSLPQGVLQLLG